jgi:hypothetical protein
MLWLKSKGKSYQTRLNEILRKAMIEEIDKAHGQWGGERRCGCLSRRPEFRSPFILSLVGVWKKRCTPRRA